MAENTTLFVTVRDAETGEPVGKARLEVWDAGAGRLVGSGVTSGKGVLELPLDGEAEAAAAVSDAGGFQFRLRLTGARKWMNDEECRTRFRIEARVNPPADGLDEEAKATLAAAAREWGVAIPRGARAALSAAGLETVGDACRAGGTTRLASDEPALKALDAHLSLRTLPLSHAERSKLFGAGYGSILDVAEGTADGLARALGGNDAGRASWLLAQAREQVTTAAAALTTARVRTPARRAAEPSRAADAVACDESISALGPGAYLHDLLAFCHRRMRQTREETVEQFLGRLAAAFYQPFPGMPLASATVTRELPQARISIEVLRAYLTAHPPAEPAAQNIAREQARYLLEAYETILTELGTSYAELRLLSTLDADRRQVLAERLGIPAANLSELLLVLGGQGNEAALNETRLWTTFGLKSTTAPPLLDGQVSGDTRNQVTSWQLDGVRWNESSDREGRVYVSIAAEPGTGGGRYSVKLYNSPQRTAAGLVGSGSGASGTGFFRISPEGQRGVSGFVGLKYQSDTAEVYFGALSRLECLRQQNALSQWEAEDYPAEQYDTTRLPSVDPAVIDEKDLRDPAGSAAGALLRARITQLAGIVSEVVGADSLERALLNYWAVPNTADAVADYRALVAATDADTIKRLTANILTRWKLAVGAFVRVMAVLEKETAHDADRSVPGPEQQELVESRGLIVSARRAGLLAGWLAEERTRNVVLGPTAFRLRSQDPDPRPGVSDPQVRAQWKETLRLRSTRPTLDPDVVQESDFWAPEGAAYRLWAARRDEVRAQLAALKRTRESGQGDADKGFGAVIRFGLGVEPAVLNGIEARFAKGERIDEDLDRLFLSEAAFVRITQIKAQTLAQGVVTTAEWAELYAILARVWKEKRFEEWRRQEMTLAGGRLIVGPDLFAVAPVAGANSTGAEAGWLGSVQARNAFVRKVRTRTEQRATVAAEALRLAQITEQTKLPIVRDALVAAVRPDLPAEERSTWVTKTLLIDGGSSGTTLTTRVAQMLQTLQSLVFALTSHTYQYPSHPFFFDEKGFEQEWTWLGTYGAWRAAVYVLLYPENLLLPQIARNTSDIFRSVLQELRLNPRLTPARAEAIGRRHEHYLDDVHRLEVKITGTADTVLPNGERAPTVFYFGIPQYVQRRPAYWSSDRLDAVDANKNPQRVWEAVPGFEGVVELIGARVVLQPEYRLLLLFGIRGNELLCARFDLNRGQWGGEPSVLELPAVKGGTWRQFFIEQHGNESNGEPLIFQWYREGSTAQLRMRRVSPDGSRWQDADFVDTKIPATHLSEAPRGIIYLNTFNTATVYLLLTTSGQDYLVMADVKTGQVARLPQLPRVYPEAADAVVEYASFNDVPTYRTAVTINVFGHGTGADTRLTFKLNLGGQWTSLVPTNITSTPLPLIFHKSVRAHGGFTRPRQGFVRPALRTALQWYDASEDARRERSVTAFFRDEQTDPAKKVEQRQVVPLTQDPFYYWPFPVQPVQTFSMGIEQHSKRDVSHTLLERNGALSPAAMRAYAREAFLFLPLLLSSRLAQRGHYDEALRWLRSVYDYTAPPRERKIYAGLFREESNPDTVRKNEDYFSDPLDPHGIAAMRKNAYTRYVLETTARLLLDYADSEFTRDTAESIPRARALYLQALDVLAIPPDAQTDAPKLYPFRPDGPIIQPLTVASPPKGAQANGRAWAAVNDGLAALASRHDEPASAGQALSFGRQTVAASHLALSLGPGARAAAPTAGVTPPPADWTLLLSPVVFCTPPNSVRDALVSRATTNLRKLRSGRNIAGLERRLAPYAAPTGVAGATPALTSDGTFAAPRPVPLRPTPYRYSALISRGKELAQLAGQVEGAMLAAIEKGDAERYNVLRAKQDLGLARASVQLQDLRVRQADGEITLANLQQERAQLQVDHYRRLLSEGLSDLELTSISMMETVAVLYDFAAILSAIPNIIAGLANGVIIDWSGTVANAAQAEQVRSSIVSTFASFERRAQEWEFQQSVATQDVRIGAQQVALAEQLAGVTRQERLIAQTQTQYADATLEFLSSKFTNAELYDWMAGVLEDVYRYFLQQATAMAQLAASQLAFERQQTPPQIIGADYWDVPTESGVTEGGATDRRGLTGSARLLRDIVQLDQFAFESDKQRLNLTKTLSLARMAPIDFQRFRTTGVLPFGTPLGLFDEDFPGHYLRLIKRVRTSVIALIPPTLGIRATLSCTGLSRVVIGGPPFETVAVTRPPSSVALTSPREATGVFELTPQPEMLLPFEGLGVDTSWELRLPRASNLFDFETIADVLVTIEYTALDSAEYRDVVIRGLGRERSAERPFSFRRHFPDQWYDLNNPSSADGPLVVSFRTSRQDFPPNIEDLRISHLALYLPTREGEPVELPPLRLTFREEGLPQTWGGSAAPVRALISTRLGNASSWQSIRGRAVAGTWEVTLPAEARTLLRDETLTDLLLSITYEGRVPQWPD